MIIFLPKLLVASDTMTFVPVVLYMSLKIKNIQNIPPRKIKIAEKTKTI